MAASAVERGLGLGVEGLGVEVWRMRFGGLEVWRFGCLEPSDSLLVPICGMERLSTKQVSSGWPARGAKDNSSMPMSMPCPCSQTPFLSPLAQCVQSTQLRNSAEKLRGAQPHSHLWLVPVQLVLAHANWRVTVKAIGT